MSHRLHNQQNNKASRELPSVPDKLYFTIGEASRLCMLQPHVLRYWEQEFSQLKPAKRCGNRRYYQKDDILIIRRIRTLLYEEGFTIEGARNKLFSENTKKDKKPEKPDLFEDVSKLLREMAVALDSVLVELKEQEA